MLADEKPSTTLGAYEVRPPYPWAPCFFPVERRTEDDGQGLRLDATIQQEGAVLTLDSALDLQKFDVALSGLNDCFPGAE